MKRWKTALVVLGCLATVAAATAGLLRWNRSTARPPLDLGVSFTCDVRGRLVPCGCFTGQMGGLTRIATMLADLQPRDGLRLDVGDAIAGTEDFHQIEHRYLLKAFARMGFDAVNIGHREAALSAAELRAIKATSPVPLLSANLIDKSTGAPLFEPYRIVKRGAWRIALVGVLDSHLAAESLGGGLAIEPAESALARLLPAIKKQADVVVLLAFCDEATLSSLARSFYELDLILGGKVSQPAQQLFHENRSLIFYTTNQARDLGSMDLTLKEAAKVSVRRADIILMHDGITQDPALQALAGEYRDEVRRTKLAVDNPLAATADQVPGIKNAASFVGTGNCLECHPNAARVWSGSYHAQAFQALVEAKADADPSCIGCHTVGFGSPGGFLRGPGSAHLTNVGCESCHGPGSQHVAQRRSGVEAVAKLRTVGAGDCQKCHHGEFSRPFSWEKFWPAVAHGK